MLSNFSDVNIIFSFYRLENFSREFPCLVCCVNLTPRRLLLSVIHSHYCLHPPFNTFVLDLSYYFFQIVAWKCKFSSCENFYLVDFPLSCSYMTLARYSLSWDAIHETRQRVQANVAKTILRKREYFSDYTI